ncbi:MAG: glycosyltransferase [Steroidobacteraceae bacterium]
MGEFETNSGTLPVRTGPGSKPFVLATFFEGRPEEGGGYVHKVGVLRVLKRMQGPALRVVVICPDDTALGVVTGIGLQGVIQRRTLWRRASGALLGATTSKRFLGRSLAPKISAVDKLLTSLGADLVFFSGPDSRALQLYAHSYIFSIWDLAHLEHPEFPEVSHFGEFERREYMYSAASRRAIAVIADSKPGCRLIAEAYRIPSARIFAAPFLISPSISGFEPNEQEAIAISKKYDLGSPYIFYPAQFWRHKNHAYILSALRVMLDQYGWAPQAVFCGADKGALSDVIASARQLEVSELVRYCGFVPNGEIPYLYRGALALVMPTYFGPSNLPPTEAIGLGTPVCYSDFAAFREVMGDSVTYVDLERPASLAEALNALYVGRSTVREKHAQGSRTILDAAEDRYLSVMTEIISRYQRKTGVVVT